MKQDDLQFMKLVFHWELRGLQMDLYREDRIRTCDPLVPNQVLYQAELLPGDNYVKMHPTGVEPVTA